MDGVCTDVTLISAVSCDRDFVDSLASVMTEGSLTLYICSMWCWMRCPDIFPPLEGVAEPRPPLGFSIRHFQARFIPLHQKV